MRYTVDLRPGVRFSDGHPLDAEDVTFTFEVHLDPAIASGIRPLLLVGGEPDVPSPLDTGRMSAAVIDVEVLPD